MLARLFGAPVRRCWRRAHGGRSAASAWRRRPTRSTSGAALAALSSSLRLVLRETFLSAPPGVRRGDTDGREDDTDEGIQEDDLYFNRRASASFLNRGIKLWGVASPWLY